MCPLHEPLGRVVKLGHNWFQVHTIMFIRLGDKRKQVTGYVAICLPTTMLVE
jgi:hypothetical protein